MGIDVEKATRAPDPLHAEARPDRFVGRHLGVPALLLRVGQRAHHLLGGDLQPDHAAGQRHQRLAGRASSPLGLVVAGVLSDWAKVRKPFMLVGAVCAMVMMVFLIRQTDHPHTGYYSNVLVIVLLAVSICVRLRAVDGELHRAGRVAQPGADRHRAGHLGLDPAHHGRAVVPRAALRHHDVDDARRQPERRRHPADDPGRAALRAEHGHVEVQRDAGAGDRHRRLEDDPRGAARAHHPRHHPAGLQQHPQPAQGHLRPPAASPTPTCWASTPSTRSPWTFRTASR